MERVKRVLGILLTLIMVVSILPTSVIATDIEYTGVELRIQSVSPSVAMVMAHTPSNANTAPILKSKNTCMKTTLVFAAPRSISRVT